MTIEIMVVGRPISQPRPRVTIRGTFMPSAYRDYRQEVAENAMVMAHELEDRGTPWDARRRAYALRAHFYMPDARPSDIDKLVATQLDALVKAGILEDDRYVTELSCRREIDRAKPRVELEVRTLL